MKDKKSNKKSNAKIYITFIIVLVILYSVGYAAGTLVAKAEKNGSMDTMLATLKDSLTFIIPPLFPSLAVIFMITVLVLFLSCRKMYKKLQDHPEDDDLWDTLEEKLNCPLILANVMQITDVFFFACIIWLAEATSYGNNGGYETAILVADVISFIVVLIVGLFITKGTVDLEKKLNPEKQGNVFDFHFNEVWLASCDEGQKLITYQAAYKAFQNTNAACAILWILAFMGMFIFKTGIFPVLYICIIWLVNNVSYMLRAAKLERRK
ncbi:MAG: DUF3169 family protein [Lachnospiraceae bacterium]